MMIFTKKRATVSMTMINTNNNMNNLNLNTIQPPVINRFNPATPVPTPTKKPMKWGEPTWFLLHTLAQKIQSDKFTSLRSELLDTIYIICTNLPCPDCANHAKNYLDSINFKLILSKEHLKKVLFDFHNTVNSRKGFPIFPFEDLTNKYSNAVTINIIHNFIFYFEDKHPSPRMISNDMYRKRISNNLKIWFDKNIQYFD
jgi:hypothetical protein